MKSGELDHAPSYVKNWPQAHSAIAMNCYPAYFDQNQLYDLPNDPYEQNNLYGQLPEIGEKLQAVLKQHLASFDHPFDLADDPYLETQDFKDHYEVNMDYDLGNIPWLRRDHGSMQWPPLQSAFEKNSQ
jgi:hypothetical protein